MDYSLPGWIGALAGMVAAAILYVPGIRFVDRRMRAQGSPASLEQREEFEQKLSLVRRVILGIDVALLATLGYWIGKAIGGSGVAPLLH